MIIVNTKATYGHSAAGLVAGEDRLHELAGNTGGDWPPLSEANLRTYADFLLGTCDGIVTVAYRITGTRRVEVEQATTSPDDEPLTVVKMRFRIDPAPEMTWMIGRDQPEGPWRQGEARGTRRVLTPPHRSMEATLEDWERAVVATARRVVPTPSTALSPAPAISASGVEIARRDDGALVVTIPAELAQTVLAGGLLGAVED